MKVMISQYPFQAVPGMAQLSFPAGARIEAKSGSTQGGWIFGSYGGREGWFPESYVVMQQQQQQTLQHDLYQKELPVTQQQQRPESPPRGRTQQWQQSTANAREAYHHQTITTSTTVNRTTTSSQVPTTTTSSSDDEDGFPLMMGGVPGDLFEGAPKPVRYTTEPQQQQGQSSESTPSFLKDEQQETEEAPVDIYRHAPARKQRNFYNADYSPEISVQITSATPTTPTYTPRKLTQVAPSPTSTTDDFYKMHPGRAPGPSTADQAFELERAFEDMRGSETIQISVATDPKKKKFPYIPKSIKKAAKKTVNAVKKH